MNSETLRAVVDCLIPPDDFPGAYDAGVCDYIDAIDDEALARFDRLFANLSPTEQIATLAAIESAAPRFFEMLVNTTAEGYYSEPQQGGNRGAISWVMTGFEEHSDSNNTDV